MTQENEFGPLATTGVEGEVREALKKCLEWLDAGGDDGVTRFKMDWWFTKTDQISDYPLEVLEEIFANCGSAGCMGGFLKNRLGMDPENRLFYVDTPSARYHGDQLHKLFFPTSIHQSWLTAAEAAGVLREYLATGIVQWIAIAERHEMRRDAEAALEPVN